MARALLVAFVYDSWADLDRVVEGLDRGLAEQQPNGGSAIAWSVGHVTNQLDGWVNSRFGGIAPHGLIGSKHFRDGGGADDWPAIQQGVGEVRQLARSFLDHLSDADLRRTIPYDGSLLELRARGLNLSYALLRIAAHHYVHTGEIAATLGSRGRRVPSLPGRLPEVLAAIQPSGRSASGSRRSSRTPRSSGRRGSPSDEVE